MSKFGAIILTLVSTIAIGAEKQVPATLFLDGEKFAELKLEPVPAKTDVSPGIIQATYCGLWKAKDRRVCQGIVRDDGKPPEYFIMVLSGSVRGADQIFASDTTEITESQHTLEGSMVVRTDSGFSWDHQRIRVKLEMDVGLAQAPAK